MKNKNSTLVILAITIIIGASIIAYAIMNKPMSSLDDCYYKLYKEYKDKGKDDSFAAKWARRNCHLR